MKNALIGVFVLATGAATTVAWLQHQEVERLRGAMLGENERASLQKKVWDLQKENQALAQAHAPAALPAEAAPLEKTIADATSEPVSNTRQQFDRGPRPSMREWLARPEIQALVTATEKSVFDAQYAALFHNLRLTPEQADRLKSLLVERRLALEDVLAASREQGFSPRTDPEGFRKLVADAQGSVNDQIRAMLGDTGFQQFSTYEQTLPQRNVVTSLQQRLTYSDTPLTNTQAEQLVQILAASGRQPAGDGPASLSVIDAGPTGLGAVLGAGHRPFVAGRAPEITAEAMAQAASFLTPAQVAALQALQQQQQNARRLQQLLRSNRQNNRESRRGSGGG